MSTEQQTGVSDSDLDAPPTPAVPLTGSWFPSPDDEPVTIALPGGFSMVVHQELEAGDTSSLFIDSVRATTDAEVKAAFDRYKILNVAAHLISWTLPTPVPATREEKIALVEKLGVTAFDRIAAALAEWVEKHGPKEIPIVPVKPLLPFDWFVAGDDAYTLDLPGGEWMRVRAELTAIDRVKLIANGGGVEAGLKKVAAYVVAWSFTHKNGRKVPVGLDSVKAMKTSRFGILSRTIEAYEAALKARDANPIGSGGSINPSASVN